MTYLVIFQYAKTSVGHCSLDTPTFFPVSTAEKIHYVKTNFLKTKISILEKRDFSVFFSVLFIYLFINIIERVQTE